MLQTHQVLQTRPLKVLWLPTPVGSALLHGQGGAGAAVLPSHESRTCSTSISCLSVTQQRLCSLCTEPWPCHTKEISSKQNWNGFRLHERETLAQRLAADSSLGFAKVELLSAAALWADEFCLFSCGGSSSSSRDSLRAHTPLGAAPAWPQGPHHPTFAMAAAPSPVKDSSCPKISEVPFSPAQRNCIYWTRTMTRLGMSSYTRFWDMMNKSPSHAPLLRWK